MLVQDAHYDNPIMTTINPVQNEAGGYAREKYDGRTFCKLNVTGKFPRGIRFSADIDNLFDFHDKNVTADQSVTPQRGIGFIGTLSVNLGDLFQL